MAEAKTFSCPSCGSSLVLQGDAAEIKCQYCGSTVVVPEQLRAPSPNTITIQGATPGAEAFRIDVSNPAAAWAPAMTTVELGGAYQQSATKWVKWTIWGVVILVIVTTVVPLVCAALGIGVAFLPFFMPR